MSVVSFKWAVVLQGFCYLCCCFITVARLPPHSPELLFRGPLSVSKWFLSVFKEGRGNENNKGSGSVCFVCVVVCVCCFFCLFCVFPNQKWAFQIRQRTWYTPIICFIRRERKGNDHSVRIETDTSETWYNNKSCLAGRFYLARWNFP